MTDFTVETDGVYATTEMGRALRWDVYRPRESRQRAAILIVHGGGWIRGDKSMVANHAKVLARDGFVVAATEYRLTPEAPWPAQIHDVKRAIRALRARADDWGFEPEKLGFQGHSAGAHLVLHAAGSHGEERFDPPGADRSISAACAAVVAVYPPVVFYAGERVSGGTPASALKGADASPETAALASPINFISAAYPPAMLLHGDADKVVPVSASRRFEEALRAAGGKVDLHLFAGQPHGFFNHPELQPPLMGMVSAFFQRHISRTEAFAPAA